MAVSSSRLSAAQQREIDLTREAGPDVVDVQGHDAEFQRLYEEFSLRVIGLVRRFISDEDLVDDIVQEAFLRAYNGGLHLEYLENDRDRDQWPWLAAVARNLALDALRKRKVAFEDEMNDEVFEHPETLDDPEVHLLASRRREGIAEALETLCPRQRRMLILKHVNGWAYHDIAATEGISVDALKSALARARRSFRTAYATIAERSGLSVIAGVLVTRVPAKLREIRDRLVNAPDAASAAMAASPAFANTIATLAVLGAVGVAGVLGGASAEASTSEVEPVSAVSTPEPPAAVETVVVSSSVAPAASSEGVSVESGSEVVVESSSTDTSPGATSAGASVDSDEVVPVDDPPAGAHADTKIEIVQDADKTLVKDEQAVGVDPQDNPVVDEEDTTVTNGGSAGWDCPPPDEQGPAFTVLCSTPTT